MEKTSKVTSCLFKNEWTNPQSGIVIYYHTIELENGDKGHIGVKEKYSPKIQVGVELTYTIEGDKIKAVSKPFVKGGKPFTPEPCEHKMAGMAFSFAKDLVIAYKVEIKQIETTAERIYQWLISKKV